MGDQTRNISFFSQRLTSQNHSPNLLMRTIMFRNNRMELFVMKKMLGIASVVLASVAATSALAVEAHQPVLQPSNTANLTTSIGHAMTPNRPMIQSGSVVVASFDPSCSGISIGSPNFWCNN